VPKTRFANFAKPTPVKTPNGEPVVLNSGGKGVGFLNLAHVDYHGEEMVLCDSPWFTSSFPIEISVDMIFSTTKFLQ